MARPKKRPPKATAPVQPAAAPAAPQPQVTAPVQPAAQTGGFRLWDNVSYIPDGGGTEAAARIELVKGLNKQTIYLSPKGRITMELHFRR